MKINWEKWERWIGWVAWICVVGLTFKIYGQYRDQSDRIKAHIEENRGLREELRAESRRYRELQRKIQSYRQIPRELLGRRRLEQNSVEEESDSTSVVQADVRPSRDSEGQSHWLLDVDDESTLALVGEISGYANRLSETEWQVVEASKELMLDKVLSKLSEEERQSVDALRKEGYFETWLNELVELTVLDSMRVNESLELEAADLAGRAGAK